MMVTECTSFQQHIIHQSNRHVLYGIYVYTVVYSISGLQLIMIDQSGTVLAIITKQAISLTTTWQRLSKPSFNDLISIFDLT